VDGQEQVIAHDIIDNVIGDNVIGDDVIGDDVIGYDVITCENVHGRRGRLPSSLFATGIEYTGSSKSSDSVFSDVSVAPPGSIAPGSGSIAPLCLGRTIIRGFGVADAAAATCDGGAVFSCCW